MRYDGAPEYLFRTTFFAVPGLALYGEGIRVLTVGGIGFAAAYALVRKRVPKYSPERFQ